MSTAIFQNILIYLPIKCTRNVNRSLSTSCQFVFVLRKRISEFYSAINKIYPRSKCARNAKWNLQRVISQIDIVIYQLGKPEC